MSPRANITSVDAIQAFRTNLLIFLSKARPALDEAASEVRRVRLWLEMERKPHWLKQYLLRTQRLDEAEAALFSATLSRIAEASAAQQAAVQKARRAVGEAEDKLRSIKRWQRDYENRTDPLLKQLEKLGNLLALDVPNAVAQLNEAIDTLQKYSGLVAPSGDAAAGAPASGIESAESGLPETERGPS
jgi:hypothetical protein